MTAPPSEPLVLLSRTSACPFASTASVRVLADWPTPELTEVRLDALAQRLDAFVAGPAKDIGGMSIHSTAQMGLGDWSAFLLGLLQGLRARDSSSDEELSAGIGRASWDFVYRSARFFLAVFAPCYAPSHARWSGQPDTGIILWQPERAFRHCGVSSHAPNRSALSEQIWSSFAERGMPYDLELTTQAPKSWRYIKPMHLGDAPVRWWLEAEQASN